MLRRAFRWIANFVAGVLLTAFVAQYLIEVGRERGWYDHPSERLDAAMSAFSAVVAQPWFIGLMVFFVGLAIGTWLDLLLGRRERRKRDDPLLARELLRFIDVRAMPTIEWWYNTLEVAKNHKEGKEFPYGTIIAYMCAIAELDMQAAKSWAERARRIDTPLSAQEMQDLVCDLHSAMLRLYHLYSIYKLLHPNRFMIPNAFGNAEIMGKYLNDLEDIAKDSRCTRIRKFLEASEKHI